VVPFRRRSGLPVRRRSRLAVLARPFLVATAIVGIPAAALWWSATSPRFGLAALEVQGSERVGEPWVRRQLDHLLGRNLVWMPLGEVERTLSGHPWVAGAEVTKQLPDRLRVVVVERRPAAILEDGRRRSWLEAGGRRIAPIPAEEQTPPEVLTVRWDGAADAEPTRRTAVLAAALGAARELRRTAPDWGRALAAVEVLGDEEFRLESVPREGAPGLPFPLLVRFGGEAPGEGSEEMASRLRRLETLLPEIRAATGAGLPEPASVDLRYRHRIVVRPAVAETGGRQERGA
jgi:cell division protein FtsQ